MKEPRPVCVMMIVVWIGDYITNKSICHDDVIEWKGFPRYWPFVRGIHRSPVNSPHKGQWRGALMFSLINAWINGWANNCEAGDLTRHRAHYDVTVIVEPLIRALILVEVIQKGIKQFFHKTVKNIFLCGQLNAKIHFLCSADARSY